MQFPLSREVINVPSRLCNDDQLDFNEVNVLSFKEANQSFKEIFKNVFLSYRISYFVLSCVSIKNAIYLDWIGQVGINDR